MLDTKLFFNIINDKDFFNLKKLVYKYGTKTISELTEILKLTSYKKVFKTGFKNIDLVYLPMLINVSDSVYKTLLIEQFGQNLMMQSIENEIENTLKIESIHSSKNSIRNIVKGFAPKTDEENKIYGIKKGLDFISDKSNVINEENLYKLYCVSIGNYLEPEDKLENGNFYRHDAVYVVGDKISHQGLDFKLLPETMKTFLEFINQKNDLNVIIKSTIIHFYFAFIHPYFDGNGRMARLLHIWYLIQNNFSSALLVSFSKLIAGTKNEYYKAFELIENNSKISGVLDVTPFISYFNKNIFSNINSQLPNKNLLEKFKKLLENKKINPKEKDLFLFAVFKYKNQEFSTLELKKDFGEVSYETVRKFVKKFERYNFLKSQFYGASRVKYHFLEY